MGLYGIFAHKLIESKVGNVGLEDTSKMYSAGHPNGQNRMDKGKAASNNDKVESNAQKEYQQQMKNRDVAKS